MFRAVVLGQLGESRLDVAIDADLVKPMAHARPLDADATGALRDIHLDLGPGCKMTFVVWDKGTGWMVGLRLYGEESMDPFKRWLIERMTTFLKATCFPPPYKPKR